jgi:hypothetical protein
MAKKKKDSRKDKREARKLAREQAEADARLAATRRKSQLFGVGVATVLGAAALYFGDGPRPLLGLVLLVGIGVFLVIALGGLGGSVKPRDRGKSGNIDYGN